MTPTLTAGLLLGVLCGVWTFVMGFTGWYKDPGKTSASLVIVAIEIAVLLWGLGRTAMKEGRTYSGQVVAGTLMSIIGGVVIIGFSLLFTNVFFPNYFNDMQPVYRGSAAEAGDAGGRDRDRHGRLVSGAVVDRARPLVSFSSRSSPVSSCPPGLAIWVRARPASQHVAVARSSFHAARRSLRVSILPGCSRPDRRRHRLVGARDWRQHRDLQRRQCAAAAAAALSGSRSSRHSLEPFAGPGDRGGLVFTGAVFRHQGRERKSFEQLAVAIGGQGAP